MTRTVCFETPTDPTLFGPDQPRPRGLLALSMRGFATWLAEHLVPYSRLVSDFGTGAVFTAVRLDYLGELRFADADWITTTTRVQVSESAKYLRLDVDLDAPRASDGRRFPVGRVHADLRLVTILEPDGLTATPGTLPGRLLDRFEARETYHPDREALARATTPPTDRSVVAERVTSGGLYRSHCEVADQWSFIEVIELLTAAREQFFRAEFSDEIRQLAVASAHTVDHRRLPPSALPVRRLSTHHPDVRRGGRTGAAGLRVRDCRPESRRHLCDGLGDTRSHTRLHARPWVSTVSS